MPRFPITDAPINQRRATKNGLIVDRYSIIGSDHIAVRVWQPISSSWDPQFSTVTYWNDDELPRGFKAEFRKSAYDGKRTACFGWVRDEETVAAAIAETFPGWKDDQFIAGAAHQSRVENWERCSPEFRAISKQHHCPTCGTSRYRANGSQCKDCRKAEVFIPLLAVSA